MCFVPAEVNTNNCEQAVRRKTLLIEESYPRGKTALTPKAFEKGANIVISAKFCVLAERDCDLNQSSKIFFLTSDILYETDTA